jgi:hypothetical protein
MTIQSSYCGFRIHSGGRAVTIEGAFTVPGGLPLHLNDLGACRGGHTAAVKVYLDEEVIAVVDCPFIVVAVSCRGD